MEREPEAEDAREAPEVEVPLCLSCSEPRDERQDFCARCGAPASTAATGGAYETIGSWGWALGASGRWGWTRRAAAIIVVAWCVGWLLALVPLLSSLHEMEPSWLFWLLAVGYVLLHLLVLRYAVRRWWRSRGTPDPRAPDEPPPADAVRDEARPTT